MHISEMLPEGALPIVPEDTPGWIRERIGHGTASRGNDMAGFQKRNPEIELACRAAYRYELVGERANDRASDHWVSEWMIRGKMEEPAAKEAFQRATGVVLSPAGFVHHPTIEWLGATPDAFIGDVALAEFKVPKVNTFVRWVHEGVVPEEHRMQMLLQLACTGRKRCQFVAFNPEAQAGPNLFVRWFEPTQKQISEAEEIAAQFLREVEALFRAYTELGATA